MQLQILNGSKEQTMSSKEIAELTGKNHTDVMRDCRVMFGQLKISEESKIAFLERINNLGLSVKDKYYLLNKEESICLVAGYDANVRMKIIKRWQELELQVQKTRVPQTFLEALEAAVEAEKQKLLALAEVESLQVQLDESKEWFSIKRVAHFNHIPWREISWRKLKRADASIVHKPKKIFDANYGEVNTYHINSWEDVYPELEIPLE